MRTKTHKAIVEAYSRGYRVTDEGELLSPYNGVMSFKVCGSQRYPSFSLNRFSDETKVYGIPVHQFAAFCFYGEESFSKDNVVRHLDSDTCNGRRENIVLGTRSENEMDKDKVVKSNASKIARAAQGIAPCNAKLSPEEVKNLRVEYGEAKKGRNKLWPGKLKELARKYNVSGVTILNIVSRKHYWSIV